MKQQQWGELPGIGAVSLYTVENAYIRAAVSDYGATLIRLETKDRNGSWANIILGYDTPADYAANTCYLGATVGRYANRIAQSAFPLNGETIHITPNENGNCLHGGVGFSRKLWTVEQKEGELLFRYHSPDGEDGFPGALDVSAAYRLEGDKLVMDYRAVSDRDTVVNLTNHAYFNLNGKGTVNTQRLSIRADRYTPVDGRLLPTGELRDVAGSRFDLRQARALGTDSFDHNFVLSGGEGPAAVLQSEESGRRMALSTDLPGLQLYTGDGLNDGVHPPRSGLCLEAQFFPDSPNQPAFPSCTLRAGEEYARHITLQFSAE